MADSTRDSTSCSRATLAAAAPFPMNTGDLSVPEGRPHPHAERDSGGGGRGGSIGRDWSRSDKRGHCRDDEVSKSEIRNE